LIRRGLFVGRFQPFHFGHLSVVKDVLKKVDELVIVVGSAQYSHQVNNPFTAGERLTMIRGALVEAEVDVSRVWVVPVPDVHLHMMWVSAVEGYVPRFEVVFSNEPLTRRLFVEAGYKVSSIKFYERNKHCSTEIRRLMIEGGKWEKFVPKSVAAFIKKIDGVNRIRDLCKSDRAKPLG
jgi:nicotinamide-nucleotide adenylyltransferase